MHIVKCRCCRKPMDIDTLPIDQWIKPADKQYYHTFCYENWKKASKELTFQEQIDNEAYYDMVKDYLWREVKLPNLNFKKIRTQWEHLISKGRTARGIYFALKYFYDYKHGDRESAQGGIGIVDSIYELSGAFWLQMNERQNGILDAVVKQQQDKINQRHIKVVDTKKAAEPKYKLEDI